MHSHILTVSVLRLSRKCDHPAPHYPPIIWRTMRTSFFVRYAFQPPALVCRPRSTKRGRRPHRLSPVSVASTCPQPAALCSGSCSSHLRGGEPLECRRGRVLPLCSRPLPLAASHSLHFDRRPSLTHSFSGRAADGARSLSHPPAGRRRRTVAFASAGRPPTARSRFRIRRPGFRICPSMSVGACPLPSPRPRCPSHHWHCRRLCRLWPSASAAMMCSV